MEAIIKNTSIWCWEFLHKLSAFVWYVRDSIERSLCEISWCRPRVMINEYITKWEIKYSVLKSDFL